MASSELDEDFNVHVMDTPDLMKLAQEVKTILQERKQSDPPVPLVVWGLKIEAGNKRAGATGWVKTVTEIDPTKSHGYAVEGDFLESAGEGLWRCAHPEGTLLLAGGRGGSWKTKTFTYLLLRVKAGEKDTYQSGYQSFKWSGLELVATDSDKTYRSHQKLVDRYPEMAVALHHPLLPILEALKDAGF